MSIEENVDVETTLTEEAVNEKVGAQPPKEASTVLGKFKDVDALARAYEALQAEFTRRSQRLRQLERQTENSQAQGEGTSGAEKLRRTANARREAAKEFDAFVAEVGAPFVSKEEPVKSEGDDGVGLSSLSVEELPVSEKTAASKREEESKRIEEGLVAQESVEKATSEELYKRASENDEVRLRIVGEYLSSLGKTGAPLTASGAGLLTSPNARARTLQEAGDMALRYFRKPMA